MISIIIGTNRLNSKSQEIAYFYNKLLSKQGVDSQIVDLKLLPDTMSSIYNDESLKVKLSTHQKMISESDKFVFIVPEYNGSFPGILKIFIEGLNYPESFFSKKCALVGLSSNNQGAILALSHLTDIFNYLGMNVLSNKVKIPMISKVFSNGEFNDPKIVEYLERQIKQLLVF